MTQPSCIDGLPDLPKPGSMTCTECGMLCEWKEFHPFAACLMFKGCRDSDKVRSNLNFVRELSSAIATHAAKQVQAGFVLAPIEPTYAMQYAAERAYVEWSYQCDEERDKEAPFTKGMFTHSDTYRAMIAAAPSATSVAEAAEAGQVEATEAPSLNDAYADGRADERDECCGAMGDVLQQHEEQLDRIYTDLAASEVDAERWRMLPAFLEEFQIEYVGLLRAIDAEIAQRKRDNAATPASPQAPAPQAVVGEASEPPDLPDDQFDALQEEFGLFAADFDRVKEFANAVYHTAFDAMRRAAPHQGADALREALIVEMRAQINHLVNDLCDSTIDEFGLQRYVPRQTLMFHNMVAALVRWSESAALAQHQAPQQGEQHGS